MFQNDAILNNPDLAAAAAHQATVAELLDIQVMESTCAG